jgi:hypothetical protein
MLSGGWDPIFILNNIQYSSVDGSEAILTQGYGGWTASDVNFRYFSTGTNLFATFSFKFNIAFMPSGFSANYRYVTFTGVLPGGNSACGALPTGIRWSQASIPVTTNIGTITAHSVYLGEYNTGGSPEARHTEGGFVNIYTCASNTFLVTIAFTQAPLAAASYNINGHMMYEVY